jgi:hypothetical protein
MEMAPCQAQPPSSESLSPYLQQRIDAAIVDIANPNSSAINDFIKPFIKELGLQFQETELEALVEFLTIAKPYHARHALICQSTREPGAQGIDARLAISLRHIAEVLAGCIDTEVMIHTELQGDEAGHGWFGLDSQHAIDSLQHRTDPIGTRE